MIKTEVTRGLNVQIKLITMFVVWLSLVLILGEVEYQIFSTTLHLGILALYKPRFELNREYTNPFRPRHIAFRALAIVCFLTIGHIVFLPISNRFGILMYGIFHVAALAYIPYIFLLLGLHVSLITKKTKE